MDAPKPMKWWFHSEVNSVHLLFEPLLLDNSLHLFLGYILIFAICWSERAVTYYLDQHLSPSSRLYGRWKHILLRTGLYAVATVLRLWYMLITMYFNTGLFVVVVVALATGQLAMEYLKSFQYAPPRRYGHDAGQRTQERRTETLRPSLDRDNEEEEQLLYVPSRSNEYEMRHGRSLSDGDNK